MQGDGLFHIADDNRLTALRESPYEAESVLQSLLTHHPDLLAGGQMDPGAPREWLLVEQELGVPDRAEAMGDRWSLDHLFVDQDAIPTLVEVKRSSDTRIRREVVGQMMDYAANAVVYWPVDRLRDAFARTQREVFGVDPDEAVADLTGDTDATVESFFDRVQENLRTGRIRLVFVADRIPDELRRIVEFLNEQMNPADVFAVEVKQYTAPGFGGRTVVPTVIGRTGTASAKQAVRRPVDPAAVRAASSKESLAVASRLEAFATAHGLVITEGPASRQLRRADRTTVAQLYYGYDSLDIDLATARSRGREEVADDALTHLQALTQKKLTRKFPSVPTSDVLSEWATVEAILVNLI